jgi:membrane-bound lytic murein transglycosylase D
MFNTGKMYDLRIDSYYDDRRDPIKSSHAACRYFKDMYAIYGDWLLVIASYNCGPGNVNKAIRRAGGNTNFWEIAKYLPAETRGYVPAFIAVTYVMKHAEEHNIFPVQPAFNYFEVDTIAVDGYTTLKKIGDAIGLPIDVITYLNPIYKRGVIPDTEQPNILRLPASYVPAYLAVESSLFTPSGQQASLVTKPVQNTGEIFTGKDDSDNSGLFTIEQKKIKKIYIVKAGDNLSVISNRLLCSVTDLRKWNKLSTNSIMKGQKLSYYSTVKIKVPVSNMAAVSPADKDEPKVNSDALVDNSKSVTDEKSTSSVEFIYHRVEKGDTLWNIAKRYEGATVDKIMELNRITNINNLVPGTKIKVKVSS